MTDIVTVAILAGGQSRRMGTDKSFVLLDGRPLIEHVIERAGALGYPVILIANHVERYRQFGLPVYADVISGAGSLGGLYSALAHSRSDHTLCLACDMPHINPRLLAYLLTLRGAADAVVPCVNSLLQPLHAVYHRRCLPVLRQRIERVGWRSTASSLPLTRASSMRMRGVVSTPTAHRSST